MKYWPIFPVARILLAWALLCCGCEDFGDDHGDRDGGNGGNDGGNGGNSIRAHFLDGWGTRSCSLGWLSSKTTDGEFHDAVDAHAAAGRNAAFVYLFCEGDMYGMIPTSVTDNLDRAATRLDYIESAGLDIWAIVVADDSPGLTGGGAGSILALFDSCAQIHGYFTGVIGALEPEESGIDSDALGSALKALGFRVGQHTMPIDSGGSWAACAASWCDYAFLQLGNPFGNMDTETAKSIINDAQRELSAHVIAFEHDVTLDGADLGADGYGCGRGA